MNCRGAHHGAMRFGYIGAEIITLAAMLRIPACIHNADDHPIFRLSAWNAFAEKPENAGFRACDTFGPLDK